MSFILMVYYFLLISLLIFLILFIIYVINSIILGYRRKKVGDYAPFIPLSNLVVDIVAKIFEMKDGDVFYDLGCGDGRVVKACSVAYPKAKCIGIERDFVPYTLARINTRNISKNRLEILKKDIFHSDISDATHIFTYLFPALLDKLLPKLEKELKSGTILVSVDFKFSKKEHEEVIDLGRPLWKLGRKVYIYKF